MLEIPYILFIGKPLPPGFNGSVRRQPPALILANFWLQCLFMFLLLVHGQSSASITQLASQQWLRNLGNSGGQVPVTP